MGANKRWKNSVRKLGVRDNGGGSGGGASGSTSSSAGTGWVSLGRFMDINGIKCDQGALARSSTQPAPAPPAFIPEPSTAVAMVKADGRSPASSMGGSATAQPPPAPPAIGASTPQHPQPVPMASYSQLGPRHRAVLFPHLPPHVPRIMPPELQGDEMVGHRIRVYWPLDKTYYSGTVTSFNAGLRWPYGVDYDDGDNENVNLNKENWHLDERDRKPLPPALLERILTVSVTALAATVHPGATVAVPGAAAAGALHVSANSQHPSVAAPAPGLPSPSLSPSSLQHYVHHTQQAARQGVKENKQTSKSAADADVGGSVAALAVTGSASASPLEGAARSPPTGRSLGQQQGAVSAMSSHQALVAFGAHLALALQTRPCEGIGQQQQQQQQPLDQGNLVEGAAQGNADSMVCGELRRGPQLQKQLQQQQSQQGASGKAGLLQPHQLSQPLRSLLGGATEMVEAKEARREDLDVGHVSVADATDLVTATGNGKDDGGSDMGIVDCRVATSTDPWVAALVPRTLQSQSDPRRQEQLLQQGEQESNQQEREPQWPYHKAVHDTVPLSGSNIRIIADKVGIEDTRGAAAEADGKDAADSEVVGGRPCAAVDTAVAEGVRSEMTRVAVERHAVERGQEVALAAVPAVVARAVAAGDVCQRTASATAGGGDVNFDQAFRINIDGSDGGNSYSGDGDLGINESDIQGLMEDAAGAGQGTEDLEREKGQAQEPGQQEGQHERDLKVEPHVDDGTGPTATQEESQELEPDLPREDSELGARRDAAEDAAVGPGAGSGESDLAALTSGRQQVRNVGSSELGGCTLRGPRAVLAAATVAASGGLDGALPVVCNHITGAFLLLHQLVACHCRDCYDQKAGKRICWTPIGFEEHAGMRSSKKWKNSIRLGALTQQDLPATALGVTAGMALGEWLDRWGLVVMPRKERRRHLDAAEVDRCIQVSVRNEGPVGR
ncbi:hypothetical protein Vretimale_17057 [Volvox reticuliferus]|uniref:SAND domain-containing protein n=1 Tax=Volvox reticuliferus TaxID=1737510 RepID=A0A8J4D1Y0_9CHLO|nr:hypothetical protein Vretifemale_18652 [Volvox reticuliferus]GIM14023.1 hypothetical protein Vretimale_17057 [Volvox reticuliferus]